MVSRYLRGGAALGGQPSGQLPQARRVLGVECIRRDAGDGRLVAALNDRRLVAVLEVPAADAVEQGRGGEQCRGGGALLWGLERAARPAEALFGLLPVVRVEVSLQRGEDPA